MEIGQQQKYQGRYYGLFQTASCGLRLPVVRLMKITAKKGYIFYGETDEENSLRLHILLPVLVSAIPRR
jgi:hypothetical protein